MLCSEKKNAHHGCKKQQCIVNPFEQEGNWYKAALHVHSTTSDGDVELKTRLKQYKDKGFDVVAITDHWTTNDVSGLSDDSFLVINSIEVHPKTYSGAPDHHIVCLDLPHPFDIDQTLPAQQIVDKLIKAGGKVMYAHPYWTAHSIEELLEVEGYISVEVYNGHCDIADSKGYGNVHIDQLLNRGHIVGLTAVDDAHRTGWLGLGWTMIKAKSLSKEDIMNAFTNGSYYASCSPIIKDFRLQNGVVSIECSPAAKISFLFDGADGGKTFYPQNSETTTGASWNFKEDKSCRWIRGEVVDAAGKHAWTNPLMIQ